MDVTSRRMVQKNCPPSQQIFYGTRKNEMGEIMLRYRNHVQWLPQISDIKFVNMQKEHRKRRYRRTRY